MFAIAETTLIRKSLITHPLRCDNRAVTTMDQSVLVAIARCPDRGHAIEEFARRNEDFQSLCADLADAEAAAV